MIKHTKNFVQRKNELDQFKTMITHFDDNDFDGHTNFEKLSPEQKLCWLSCCAYFLAQIKRENIDSWIAMESIPLNAIPKSMSGGHAPRPGL